jgi:hypothetical protein
MYIIYYIYTDTLNDEPLADWGIAAGSFIFAFPI